MNRNLLFRTLQVLALAAAAFPFSALSADTMVIRTNYAEKYITNTIEMRIPRNVFVTEFRTNRVDQYSTNLVIRYTTNYLTAIQTNVNFVDLYSTNVLEAYKTNWTTRHLTNEIAVDLFKTNFVDNYNTNWTTQYLTNEIIINLLQTNFVSRFNTNWIAKYLTNWTTRDLTNEVAVNLVRTNFVDRYRTNWTTKDLINEVAINQVRTNFVDRYQTNLKTLNFTNWQTVLVMKTNWVNHPVTNVVQLDLPLSQNSAGPRNETPAADPSDLSGDPSDGPLIEAVRTGRPGANNTYEISLRVKWPSPAPQQVQHWWLERQDGAYLSVGQDREFKRELPPGTYRIEAKVQHDGDSLVQTLRGVMVVTTRDVVVTQKPSGKKFAVN